MPRVHRSFAGTATSVAPGSRHVVRAFFETPRLCARPFTYDDLEAFVAYRRHPQVERYQSWSSYTLEQGRSQIASMQELQTGVPGEWYQIALEDGTVQELVGDLALRVEASEPREAEVGFTLAPDQQCSIPSGPPRRPHRAIRQGIGRT